MARGTFRQRLYSQLDFDAWHGEAISHANALVAFMVAISIAAASILTEPRLAGWHDVMLLVLKVCAVFFTAEYAARLWVKMESPRWRAHRLGPLGWTLRWYAVLDLLAVIGVWIEVIFGIGFGFSVMLRLLRFLRVFASSADTAFGRAGREIVRAVRERRMELLLAAGVAGLVLVAASVAMYLAERHVQPEVFGSIPRAMWWAVVTLTTVGYGDATPVTPIGRIIASITALGSVALIALPAGIMAAAFSDAVQRAKRRDRDR